jgi:serine/threonine-protein kinase
MKPENVFLCPSDAGGVIHDRVKVLDFGISKIRGSQTVVTQESVLIGTPQYMAPEQALGRNQEIDARADQFALGCILYEMLAGKPPFSGDSLAAVIYAIVHGPHVPLGSVSPGVPRGVAAALDRALAKKADDRFPDIGAFVEGVTGRPLETLRGGEGGGGAPKPAPSRPATLPMDPMAATAASTGSGTVPPAPPLTAAPTQNTRRSPVAAIVVGVVALAAIAGGIVGLRSRDSVVQPSPPPVVNPAPLPGAVAPPPAAPEFQDEPYGPPPPQPPVDEKRAVEPRPAPAASGGKRAGARADAETVPAAAAAELAQAEEALGRGNTAEAIRLAQHSLYAGKSSRAFAITTRARCRQGDLGGARAALGQVSGAQRGAVLRDCAAHGMDLR